MLYWLFSSFLISFLTTFFLIPVLQKVAFSYSVIDYPNTSLKKHKNPTPYLGGVAVFFGFLVGIFFFLSFTFHTFFLIIGLLIFLLVGLWDDIIAISPLQKVIGQSTASVILLLNGYYINSNFFNFYFNLLISFFWIISVVNAINLVDVMDGLATIITLIATIGFIFLALCAQQISYNIYIFLGAFLGALVAFFIYNKPLAKIYLGDAGSHLLGAFLSIIPMFLYNNSVDKGFSICFSSLIILIIPLLEMCLLVCIRLYKNIPFYYGSRHHYCHYLLDKNYSVWLVLSLTIVYGMLYNFLILFYMCNILSLYKLIFIATILVAFWVYFIYSNKK